MINEAVAAATLPLAIHSPHRFRVQGTVITHYRRNFERGAVPSFSAVSKTSTFVIRTKPTL